tara:strand:- start:12 stop:1493 length:1482 start_codon:yes stop_codon:yes gene_type:complete
LKVAFVTPELLSLVRRTNLAEIAEYLPRTLRREGADVRVFIPHAKEIDSGRLADVSHAGTVTVKDGEGTCKIDLIQGRLGEVPVILFDHPTWFRDRHPYGDDRGPYADNWRRYAIFSRAVLASFEVLEFKADVIHCMDWTSGLIPILHQLEHVQPNPKHWMARTGTYFAVHNPAMQGSFEREILPKIGVPHEYFRAIEGIEHGGKVNYLKAGAEFATIVGTHSPTQVDKVDELPAGTGLNDTMKRRKKELVGVMNGIDYRAWDPSTDPLLAQPFGSEDKDPTIGKKKCKAAVQQAMKLDNGPRTPLLAIIGRFDSDSGFEVLAEALTPMLERNIQLVMMGPGQPEILERMHTIEQTFSGRCRVIEGYNVNTAHVMLGGVDMLILPGHFHASNALCAIGMRYGVVPIAYAYSGLEDTIVDLETDTKNGTGFVFPHYESESLLDGIDAARSHYKDAGDWRDVVKKCLGLDFSWMETARNQLKAYRRVTRRVRSKK